MPNKRWRMPHPPAQEDAHTHGPSADADPRWLRAGLALIIAFMAAEVVAGVLAHSLALISDAAHMLTDAASIALVLVTMKLAARPARGSYTYGLKRTEILSAQANGITLVVLAVWLGYEAVRRLISPPTVTGSVVTGVALAGVAVNVAVTMFVGRASRGEDRSLNVEGAFRHIVTDLYAFIATAVAGLIIIFTGFERADAIASLVVVALMLAAGAGLIRDSGRIFLEAAPVGLVPAEIGAALAARPHVAEVHDLHIWQITSGLPAASAHVLVEPDQDCHTVRADLEELLGRYGISHTTLQVDHAPALLTVGRPPCSGTECGERAEREVPQHGPGHEHHDHGRPQPAGPAHLHHGTAPPAPDERVQPGQGGERHDRHR
jgi:cobalt-zinc-cadmium efflux system protein